jgi:hypothetical protein
MKGKKTKQNKKILVNGGPSIQEKHLFHDCGRELSLEQRNEWKIKKHRMSCGSL